MTAADTTTETVVCVDVTLATSDPLAEAMIEGALWTLPVEGVERQDDDTWSELIEDPMPRPPGSVRWRVLFDSPEVEQAAQPVRDALSHVEVGGDAVSVSARRLDITGYRTAWREFFRPTMVSHRLYVHPPWDNPNHPDMVGVEIDPGMGFGTGTHPTTRLCMREIDRLADSLDSMLDVGCGSGILSIAAALLGVDHVVGIDNDPVAIADSLRNAGRNSADIPFSTSTIAELREAYGGAGWQLVVANILPHILSVLRPALQDAVSPGGALLISGIPATRLAELRAEFESSTFRYESSAVDGEWCAITLRRV